MFDTELDDVQEMDPEQQTMATPVADETPKKPSDPVSPLAGKYGDPLLNEKLPPRLQVALQLLLTLFANEDQRPRRAEVERVLGARQMFKGVRDRYYAEFDGTWNTNQIQKDIEDGTLYNYVTNMYQAFGLSIMAVLSQDIPGVVWMPTRTDNPQDVAYSEVAKDITELVQRNNDINEKQVSTAYYLWTDGVALTYTRYVTDGARFGYTDEDEIAQRAVKFGEDHFECDQCGEQTPASSYYGACQSCMNPLADDAMRPAPQINVPVVTGTKKVPNGAEVIDVYGALEVKRPSWAKALHEFPYLILDLEVHISRLKAKFPWAKDKIGGGASSPDDTNAALERNARRNLTGGDAMDTAQGSGDAAINLRTFRQGWLRPEAFEMIEHKQTREELIALFPAGVYVGFAGDAYCCSRNEAMDDHWEEVQALPGDGQDRGGVGTSFESVQERYDVLTNLVIETAEKCMPETFISPDVVDFEAYETADVRPGDSFPALKLPPGQKLEDGFYEKQAAQVSPEVINHMNELAGPVGQFLTGAFPALFGGDQSGTGDTASGYAMARDQAMGRIGLVWRRMKVLFAGTMLNAVECFKNNRPDDVQVPLFGDAGTAKAKWIRKATLKGNIYCFPETDSQYPVLWSQQKAVITQLLESPDPYIQKILGSGGNVKTIVNALGIKGLSIPDDDIRQKQLTEIDQLLADGQEGAGPVAQPAPMMPAIGMMPGAAAQPQMLPSVEIDPECDNHEVEMETCLDWINSPSGQKAKQQNPNGYLNVRAHYLAHKAAMLEQQTQQIAQTQAAAAAAQPQAAGAQQ